MKKNNKPRWLLLAVVIGSVSVAAGSEYQPPDGFAQYTWDTPLSRFQRLQPDPVYVRIAHSNGETTDFDMQCFLDGGTNRACSTLEGEGFHALAEYFVDSQGFRLTDADGKSKSVLFPITYQFCAHWTGFRNEVKGDMSELMKFCGVRLHFRSETAAQEKEIRDPDFVTTSERVLKWLVETYGEPEGYTRRGVVIVQGQEGQRETAPRKSRFDNWYWCQPGMSDVLPRCKASIVFTFDSETGRGQAILLTPLVWAYAYARQYGGSEGDPLYRVLHGNGPQPVVRHVCTGSFLCDPPPPKPMSETMLSRFRFSAGPMRAESGPAK